MLTRLSTLCSLPPSRRTQWFKYVLQRLITVVFLKPRLRSCGSANIIEKPLFWTPEFVSLGNGCHIWPTCRIEGVSSYASQMYDPHILIGDNVSIQQNCHITAASTLTIGNDVTVMCGVVITDIDHGYNDAGVSVALQSIHVQKTYIGDYCAIGAGAKILAGTELGENCIVGANAVVRGRFPPGSMIAGIPAKIIKRYDFSLRTWCSVLSE